LERCLEVIAAQEDAVGAFVTLNITGARAAADASTARWKAGATLSPIDGMPVGIKDIMETADMATEQGSPLFVGWHGKRDGAAVAALREAGAGVLGKTVARAIALRAGGDPGYPGLSGPIELPAARQPRRLALLETAGWPEAAAAAKQALAEAHQRLQTAGIEVIDRTSHDAIAALETAIAEARPLSMAINAWEGRWPLNTYASYMDRH